MGERGCAGRRRAPVFCVEEGGLSGERFERAAIFYRNFPP